MDFDPVNHPLPFQHLQSLPPTTAYQSSVIFFINHWICSVDHYVDGSRAAQWSLKKTSRGHFPEEKKWLFPNLKTFRSLARGRALWAPPHMCWDLEWPVQILHIVYYDSWIQWSYHVQKTLFCSTPLNISPSQLSVTPVNEDVVR